jgi:DNA-binding response OmpR family regulator
MRILIVDDDPLILESLQPILEAEGHRVTASNGGQAGIDAFKLARGGPNPYGLVITDARMPRVAGHRVVAAVKELSPTTPVIILTGAPEQYVPGNDGLFREDFILTKPADMRALRAAVSAAALRERALVGSAGVSGGQR